MVKVRLTNDPPPRRRPRPQPDPLERPEPETPAADPTASAKRGLTERQWFISLLVISGLLLLITFRGCILPSGVGPKSKPAPKPTAVVQPTTAPQAVTEYTVEAGDTPSSIAQKVGVNVDALLQVNGLNRRSILNVGQKLKIPPK